MEILETLPVEDQSVIEIKWNNNINDTTEYFKFDYEFVFTTNFSSLEIDESSVFENDYRIVERYISRESNEEFIVLETGFYNQTRRFENDKTLLDIEEITMTTYIERNTGVTLWQNYNYNLEHEIRNKTVEEDDILIYRLDTDLGYSLQREGFEFPHTTWCECTSTKITGSTVNTKSPNSDEISSLTLIFTIITIWIISMFKPRVQNSSKKTGMI